MSTDSHIFGFKLRLIGLTCYIEIGNPDGELQRRLRFDDWLACFNRSSPLEDRLTMLRTRETNGSFKRCPFGGAFPNPCICWQGHTVVWLAMDILFRCYESSPVLLFRSCSSSFQRQCITIRYTALPPILLSHECYPQRVSCNGPHSPSAFFFSLS
jgi:hypothetical protein